MKLEITTIAKIYAWCELASERDIVMWDKEFISKESLLYRINKETPYCHSYSDAMGMLRSLKAELTKQKIKD